MSVDTSKVCCNCKHCIRSRDEKYDMIVCYCDVHKMYLSYAQVLGSVCGDWEKEEGDPS